MLVFIYALVRCWALLNYLYEHLA